MWVWMFCCMTPTLLFGSYRVRKIFSGYVKNFPLYVFIERADLTHTLVHQALDRDAAMHSTSHDVFNAHISECHRHGSDVTTWRDIQSLTKHHVHHVRHDVLSVENVESCMTCCCTSCHTWCTHCVHIIKNDVYTLCYTHTYTKNLSVRLLVSKTIKKGVKKGSLWQKRLFFILQRSWPGHLYQDCSQAPPLRDEKGGCFWWFLGVSKSSCY